MRCLALVAAALAAGCGGQGGGSVSIVLDIPNANLDPKGFSSVEVRIHTASGDVERSVAVFGGQFDLGDMDPIPDALIDAVLRTDSGTAVGYGRAATATSIVAGATITIPVRRPIVYTAGLVSIDQDGNPATNDVHWSEVAATYSDLSSGTTLDGSTTVGSKAVFMVAAGPTLYLVEQATSDPNGTFTGPATIKPVSTGDHSIAVPLTGTMMGGVLDGAGTDDGSLLVIGTTTQLFVVNTQTGAAKPITDGSFGRVAIVSSGANALTAIAIKNRPVTTGTCVTTAELVWIAVNADDTNQVMSLGTGGFTDVAGDRGHAYYVDACKGELGEATPGGLHTMRTMLGKPTALTVSGTQAWIGIERPPMAPSPAVQVSLVVASLTGTDTPRTLFSEPATQVLEASLYPGVQRRLDASTAVFNHLEIGAGGDYVATTIAAHYTGMEVTDANFPEMTIDTEELRVVDASSGAVVQRYRSWCDGVLTIRVFEIPDWRCATSTGQSAPGNPALEHRINSMTFQFGKK